MRSFTNIFGRITGSGQRTTTSTTGTQHVSPSIPAAVSWWRGGAHGCGQTASSTTLCTSTSSTKRQTSLLASSRPKHHTTCQHQMPSLNLTHVNRPTMTRSTQLASVLGDSVPSTRLTFLFTVEVSIRFSSTMMFPAAAPMLRTVGESVSLKSSALRVQQASKHSL